MLKVPLNADGFFVEAHLKLRPVDFATEGIFLCGLAHSPKHAGRKYLAGARRRRTGGHRALQDTAGGQRPGLPGRPGQVHLLHDLRPRSAPTAPRSSTPTARPRSSPPSAWAAASAPRSARPAPYSLNHFETEQFNAMLDELFKSRKRRKQPAAVPEKSGVL